MGDGFEWYRWHWTIAILVELLVFCVVLFFGVARHSEFALNLSCMLGAFALIQSWIMVLVYFWSSMVLGDLWYEYFFVYCCPYCRGDILNKIC